MSTDNELILLVPGMGAKEPEEYLDKLASGITDYCEGRGYEWVSVDDSSEAGQAQRKITITAPSGDSKTLAIQEAYWADLRPRLSTESAHRKFARGLDLLLFWLGSAQTLLLARHSKYMMFNMIFTLVLLFVWYYGALAAGITAIGANPDLIGTDQPLLPQDWADHLKFVGERMGGWYVWVSSSLLMLAIPMAEIIDISYGTKAYLQNRQGLRHKIVGRVAKALGTAYRNADSYQRITVVGHSFGVAVATQTLAGFSAPATPALRFVSLGGPLLLMSARSPRLDADQANLVQQLGDGHLAGWVDFYSNHDWLCTASPVPNETPGFTPRPITTTVSWDKRVNGESHSLYFSDWDVMAELVGF